MLLQADGKSFRIGFKRAYKMQIISRKLVTQSTPK